MSDYISTQAIMCSFTERVIQTYTENDEEKIINRKERVLGDIKYLEYDGKLVIHDNQQKIASEIVEKFADRKIINIMVVSPTQSGKTGSMVATIKKYLENSNNLIPVENIFIITGVSSCDWKEQTKARMPDIIKIYHRADLLEKKSSIETFVNEIKGKKNVIIIMDEVHVAAKKDQTIYKAFKCAGLLDKNKLYENDVKILEYTATPDGTIYQLEKWGDASAKIVAKAGNNYTSAIDLLNMGRVKQFKDLYGYNKNGEFDNTVFDNIRELKTDIDKYEEPLYHIIRTRPCENGENKTVENLKKIFDSKIYNYFSYDMRSKLNDINNLLFAKPEKHTFVIIIEKLRCAKSLEMKYIGVVYERYTQNIFDSTIIQGLLGRVTGYYYNDKCICYTNLETIELYEKHLRSNFDNKNLPWHSATTVNKGGKVSGRNTFNDPSNYDRLSVSSDDNEVSKEVITQKFNTIDEVSNHIKLLKKENTRFAGCTGPRFKNYTQDADGFYLSTIARVKKVRTVNDILKIKKWGLDKVKHRYTVFPCYDDTNDKSTLKFVISYLS